MLNFQTPIGFVGERKAVSQLCLAFYVALFSLLALVTANAPPDYPEMRAWWPCWAALGLCYGIGFFSLAAGWFWARWYAAGLGYSGLTMAFWAIIMQRVIDPSLLFYGITHGLVLLLLQGEQMTAEYDGQSAWRERFKLDEAGVTRIRHTVTRAATSLPTLIMIALAPRESQMGVLVLGMALLGLMATLQARTYGVLLLGGAGLGALILSVAHHHAVVAGQSPLPESVLHGFGSIAALMLLGSVIPFVAPMVRFLSRPAPTA